MRWLDLYPYLQEISRISSQRDSQKKNYQSTKNWSIDNSTHFVGCCAEMCVSIYTGLPMNTTLSEMGDDGYDFIHNGVTYDVKGVTWWTSPDIKEFPDKIISVDYYILVAIRDNRYARVSGWATNQQIKTAPSRNYRYGKMLSIPRDVLRSWNQLGLPNTLPLVSWTTVANKHVNLVP